MKKVVVNSTEDHVMWILECPWWLKPKVHLIIYWIFFSSKGKYIRTYKNSQADLDSDDAQI